MTHLKELGWTDFTFKRGSWSGSNPETGAQVEVYHLDDTIYAASSQELSKPLNADMKAFAEEITDTLTGAEEMLPEPQNFDLQEPGI